MKKLYPLLFILILVLPLITASSIFLRDHLKEGENKTYMLKDGIYVLNLVLVSDSKKEAIFKLNGEISSGIEKGESYRFKDGSEIVIMDILLNEAGEKEDEVYYYFYGTGKNALPSKKKNRTIVRDNLNKSDKFYLNDTRNIDNNSNITIIKNEKHEIIKTYKEYKNNKSILYKIILSLISFFILLFLLFILKNKKYKNIF